MPNLPLSELCLLYQENGHTLNVSIHGHIAMHCWIDEKWSDGHIRITALEILPNKCNMLWSRWNILGGKTRD